jgi:hypothetical protein
MPPRVSLASPPFCVGSPRRALILAACLLACVPTGPALAQVAADHDPRALAGHWDRITAIESFSNVPGATRRGGAEEREAAFTAAGQALFDANLPGYGPRAQMRRNDPLGRCEPLGLPRHLNAEIIPPHATFELVETPGRLLQFFEYRHDWREIWMDGRPLPTLENTFPKWNGYSVGRWEGDTLVVESIGFDDRTWLDKLGYPHSESMRLEERYRRVDADTLELTMTVVDPVVYNAPLVSDRKRFRLNREKSNGWDEQIYCIPAEEMTYQDVIGTGNVIE